MKSLQNTRTVTTGTNAEHARLHNRRVILEAIRLGGEGETEMGVFSAAAEGLRMANLTSLFDDFVPFGLEAGLIDDTRSSAVATRRNRP